MAWLAFLPIPLIIWGSVRFQRRIEPRYAAVREQAAAINSLLSNDLGGIATIKSVHRRRPRGGPALRGERRVPLGQPRRDRLSVGVLSAHPNRHPDRLLGDTLYGGFLVLDGALNVGLYSVMVFLTQRLLWPLTRLGRDLRPVSAGDGLDQPRHGRARHAIPPQRRSGPLPTDDVRGEVAFEDVTFAYEDGFPVLRDVSIEIPAGSTTAFVGPTGSGKTTIVKLLLRFYDPATGTVRIDGIDVRRCAKELRRSIGLVSQDVFLFHGTVRENIAYGSPDATPRRSSRPPGSPRPRVHHRAARAATTPSSANGARSSPAGSASASRSPERCSTIRRFSILDEATSAVDNETEAAIQRSLARIAHRRTTIVIAHRLSTIRHADRIYVVDRGAVIERGSHEQLLDHEGIYQSLWMVQTGEAVAER